MATAKNKLLSADDLLRLSSQGVKGELIEGVLHETVSVGKIHARIAGRIITGFNNFVIPRRLGQVGGTDGGVFVERNPDTVREPDVYFVSADRLPLDDDSDGYLEVVPELVVEVVSPSDSEAEVAEKITMWLDLGVSMALQVRPAERAVMVHRPGSPAVTLTGDDALDGRDVLPGFALPLSEIFDP
jgi:Uma2 family endonuclease